MFRLAFSANAFGRYSLPETIGILAGIGYQGIEIMADVPHAYPPHLTGDDRRRLRRALTRNRLAVSNVNAFMLHAEGDTWHPSWIERDPARRRRRVTHTLNCIDLAADLGAPSISTEPGGPLEGMEPAAAVEMFLEGLQSVETRAREQGVRVLIEPEPGLLVENSRQFLALLAELDSEVFGLNFDIGHFYCVGEDPALLVRELAPYTDHFHLEDIAASRKHHHLMPGRGAIDLRGVLREIAASGFNGFVTVELYPYADRPVAAAREAFAWLASRPAAVDLS
ncbi:MAG: sugar phosphate isomerase/epimerase [Deltaproteobacteria bacterium]|nr:sugar phosphate isomerase/epimerase [Deltaproteobacteria bacterium]